MAELRLIIPNMDAYWILTRPTGQRGLVCGTCGRLTWHSAHVETHYCPMCERDLDTPVPKSAQVPSGDRLQGIQRLLPKRYRPRRQRGVSHD